VIARSPDAFLIEFATNDAVYDKFGITPADCRTNTLLIIDRVLERFPDCEIFLHSPCGYPIGDNLINRPDMWVYNNVYRDICLERGYVWINTANFFKSVAEDPLMGETVLKAYQGDGVHATEKGALEILYPGVLKAMLTGESLIMDKSPGRYGILLNMTPDYISQSASTDMSSHSYPYNWAAASGQLWTSSNVFAQYFTTASSSAYLGKCIRFGKTDASVGSAVTPLLDLSATNNESVSLTISITAGSNKSGTLNIFLDNSNTPLLSINAKTANNGNPFQTGYYTFQTPIINGSTSSRLRFEQSKTESGGNLYVNSIKVERKDLNISGVNNTDNQNINCIFVNAGILRFNQRVATKIFGTDGRQYAVFDEFEEQIDITHLPTGFYVLFALSQNKQTSFRKIVKR